MLLVMRVQAMFWSTTIKVVALQCKNIRQICVDNNEGWHKYEVRDGDEANNFFV